MKPYKKKKAKGRAKPPHPLTMEEAQRIKRLLSEPQDLSPSTIQKELTGPPMAIAFMEKLTLDLPQVVSLVSTVRESFPQKEVQRAVKKTIFRLKKKGVILAESDKKEKEPVFIKAPEREKPTSFIGPVDGMGNRPLMLVIPQIPSGVDLAMAFTNDETGLVEFLFGRYSKRAMREVKDLFFQREPNMVETSISHGATLLEEAYRLTPSSSGDSSKQYLKLRPWILDHVELLEKPAIYDIISPKNVTTKSVTFHDIEKLFAQPLMESWILEVETMRPVLEGIRDTDESLILISEEQKMDRIRDIKEKAVADLFPMDKRLIVKRRLEEMAYLFAKRSEGDLARLALQIGLSLEAETDSFLVNPFLLALIERSVDFFETISHYQEGEPLEEDPLPMIIRP